MGSLRPKSVSACWRTSAEFTGMMQIAASLRRQITLVNGCFDLFHSGHVTLLHSAAAEAVRRRAEVYDRYAADFDPGLLVVAINSDASIRRLKGTGRPHLPWAERAAVVAAVGVVDVVVGFDEDTPLELVEFVKPKLLVKGADYMGKTVPEAVALPDDGTVLYCDRDATSSSWVAGRVLLGEAERGQEAAMLRRRIEMCG